MSSFRRNFDMWFKMYSNKKYLGSTEIRTRIAEFKVQSANTIEPTRSQHNNVEVLWSNFQIQSV